MKILPKEPGYAIVMDDQTEEILPNIFGMNSCGGVEIQLLDSIFRS